MMWPVLTMQRQINPAYQFEQLDAVLPGNILAAWVA